MKLTAKNRTIASRSAGKLRNSSQLYHGWWCRTGSRGNDNSRRREECFVLEKKCLVLWPIWCMRSAAHDHPVDFWCFREWVVGLDNSSCSRAFVVVVFFLVAGYLLGIFMDYVTKKRCSSSLMGWIWRRVLGHQLRMPFLCLMWASMERVIGTPCRNTQVFFVVAKAAAYGG